MAIAKAIIYTKSLSIDGTSKVVIKITHNRERKFFDTNLRLTPQQFERVTNGKRLNTIENNILTEIASYVNRANEIIKGLPIFTYALFEGIYYSNRTATNTISGAFAEYIEYLYANNQVGTGTSYNTAKNCLDIHFKNLKFADITPTKLKNFEKKMISEGKSLTTVSIYVRCLRTLFNYKSIPQSLQPFHRNNNKQGYSIPSVNNTKKALTAEQIAQIYNYDASAHPLLQRAKDYFIFIFLCNGMNINDMCNMKWEQINGNLITYERQKTLGKSKTQNKIQVSLKADALAVIKKYGLPSVLPTAYVFPHYNNSQSLVERKKLVGLLTRSINDYLEIISKDLKLKIKVTTQYARHSFATILKRANTSSEQISEMLGHSSLNTTKHYLASFEAEQIHKSTDVLSDILRKAN